MGYYESQFLEVFEHNFASPINMRFVNSNTGKGTKWLGLNEESADVLVKFLEEFVYPERRRNGLLTWFGKRALTERDKEVLSLKAGDMVYFTFRTNPDPSDWILATVKDINFALKAAAVELSTECGVRVTSIYSLYKEPKK